MKKSDVDAPRPEHSPSPTPREHSIERLLSLLESFTEGSRDLDARIDIEIKGCGHWRSDMPGWVVGHGEQPWQAPHYTTSLDAALTLVPEGWEWSAGRYLIKGAVECEGTVAGDPANEGCDVAHAATVPLALCIASLRARSAK